MPRKWPMPAASLRWNVATSAKALAGSMLTGGYMETPYLRLPDGRRAGFTAAARRGFAAPRALLAGAPARLPAAAGLRFAGDFAAGLAAVALARLRFAVAAPPAAGRRIAARGADAGRCRAFCCLS